MTMLEDTGRRVQPTPNPFDQFDTPAAKAKAPNPFDQFDEPAGVPPSESQQQPKWPSMAKVPALNLTPQEQNLYQHHLDDMNNGKFVRNPDGGVSTLYQSSQEIDGKTYNFPTVWDGKILPPDQGANESVQHGGLGSWPSYPDENTAESRYGAMHDAMAPDVDTLDRRQAVAATGHLPDAAAEPQAGANPFDQFDTPPPQVPGSDYVQPLAPELDLPESRAVAGTPEPTLENSVRYVMQKADRGVADFIGAPVDLTTAGLNLSLAAADRGARLVGGDGIDYRFREPFMGSDWIASKAAEGHDAVGGKLIGPDEVSANTRMIGEATRFGTGAVLGGASLASAPVQAATQAEGRLASILGGYAAPYKEAPRALVGDAAAGAGAGATVSS